MNCTMRINDSVYWRNNVVLNEESIRINLMNKETKGIKCLDFTLYYLMWKILFKVGWIAYTKVVRAEQSLFTSKYQWDKYLFISLFRYVVVWVVELSYGSRWADNNMVINLWYSIALLSLNAKKLSAILCLYYDSKVCWSEQTANSHRWQCQRATGLNQVNQIIWRHLHS